MSYAAISLGSLFDVLRDLKAAGDFRGHHYTFVNDSWRWFMQIVTPVGQFVNCYDSGVSQIPNWSMSTPLPAMFAAATGSSDPLAVVAKCIGSTLVSTDCIGIVVSRRNGLGQSQ